MSEQNYERTSCPELWKQSCWGRQPYQGNPEVYIHREVLGSLMCKPNGAWRGENIRLRATSKTDGLTKFHCFTNNKDGSMPHSDFYDHSEFYTILGGLGRMMWFSPYMSQDNPNADIILSHGWVEVKPLYSTSCRTFMKVVLGAKKNSNALGMGLQNWSTVEAAKTLGYDITPLLL